ncbi:MAG: glutamate--tRNA ligase, partial [Acidimicrobiales bacterium]
NGEYLRALTLDDFVAASRPWLEPPRAPWPAPRFDEAVFRRMAPLVQERVSTLGEVPGMVDFLFLAEPAVDQASWESVAADDGAPAILQGAIAAFGACSWDAEALHGATLALAEAVGRKLGKAQTPIRVAVTGRRVGPPLFESMEVLGRSVVLERLASGAERLGRPAD